jgi:hypothetical protein
LTRDGSELALASLPRRVQAVRKLCEDGNLGAEAVRALASLVGDVKVLRAAGGESAGTSCPGSTCTCAPECGAPLLHLDVMLLPMSIVAYGTTMHAQHEHLERSLAEDQSRDLTFSTLDHVDWDSSEEGGHSGDFFFNAGESLDLAPSCLVPGEASCVSLADESLFESDVSYWDSAATKR